MAPSTVTHSSFAIERELRAPPSKVFDAFADPVKKRRWFAESEGYDVDRYSLDFTIGGFERSGFRVQPGAPIPAGTVITNDTLFLDIVPARRIVFTYTMTVGGARISASLATFEFQEARGGGTRLVMTEQAAFFEASDGAQVREQGWQSLLNRLVQEIDPAPVASFARAGG